MALPDFDSAVGHSFGLEIDGIIIKAIQEVSGLKMEQDTIELKANTPDGKYINKKLPGRPKSGEITLTRPMSGDTTFEGWIKKAHNGQLGDARKSGAIIVFDFEGTPIKRYVVDRMWAKSLELGTLKAGDTSVLTEKLVITYESLRPE
jgi:phage tail-like protein